jgi:photosynthetic reaction center cytochrome c subunit
MKNGSFLTTAATAVLVAGAALLAGCGERPPVDTVQRGYRGTGMELVYNPRIQQTVAAANQAPVPLPPADPSGPRASEVYQNVQVLKDLSVGEFTRVMLSMAQWVVPANAPPEQQSCNYCHGANMADESKYTYRVARRMLQMTRHVNSQWSSHVGQTGVTCYTCHHGQAVPQYIWFTDPGPRRETGLVATRAEQNVPSPATGLATLPYDPFTPFLLKDYPIRVQGANPLPAGNFRSIKETEWTYSLMIHMSRSLGVNCTYCHNSRAWSNWNESSPQRVTSWYGIRMARDLNNTFMTPLTGTFPPNRLGPLGDVAKVNCSTCHRGVYKPMYGVPMLKDYPELAGERPIPAPVDPAAAPADGAAVDGAAADGAAPAADAAPAAAPTT